MAAFKRIIVGTDFGASSRRAVELAGDLALQHDAELVLVHVIEPLIPPYPIDPLVLPTNGDTVEAAALEELEEELRNLRLRVPSATATSLRGKAAEEMTRFAEESNADLVVVGTHGRKGPSRWLMGSVAEKTVRLCHVPVLTVRGDDAEGDGTTSTGHRRDDDAAHMSST